MLKLKDLAGLDDSLNDLSQYTVSPFLFNLKQEASMPNNNPIPTSAKSIDFETEFLLIFSKMRKIEAKLDLLFKALNPNPEALLAQSERNLITNRYSKVLDDAEQWMNDLSESRTNEADNTPTGS